MQIISKYRKLSDPAKASIWFTICSILQKGIMFLTTPIFTRMLSTTEYGYYTVFMSWYAIISIFTTLNLSAGVYNKGLIKFEDKNMLTASFLGLSTFLSIITLIIYLPFREYFNGLLELTTPFVILIFIESIFQPAFLLWSVGERFDYKYKKLVIVTLIISVLNPGLGVFLLHIFGKEAIWRVVAYVVTDVVVGVILGRYIFLKGKTLFNVMYWKYALKFNLPLIPHYLSMTLLNQADRLMINSMVGSSQAAIYSIAFTISSMMSVITTAINGSFIPFSYKSLKEKQYLSIGGVANQLLLIIAVLCTGTMLFGPELIWVVGGEKYVDAIWIIPPVAASVYFMFLYPLFGNIEFYYEKTKYVMIASCIGSVAKILLNYICIPIFGYLSAGYTTLLCYILFSLGHYFFYRKICKEQEIEEDIYNIKMIFLVSVVMLIVMGLMTLLYKSVALRYSVIFILLIILIVKRKYVIASIRSIKR